MHALHAWRICPCFEGYDIVFDRLNLFTKSIGVKENLILEIFRVSCIC